GHEIICPPRFYEQPAGFHQTLMRPADPALVPAGVNPGKQALILVTRHCLASLAFEHQPVRVNKRKIKMRKSPVITAYFRPLLAQFHRNTHAETCTGTDLKAGVLLRGSTAVPTSTLASG